MRKYNSEMDSTPSGDGDDSAIEENGGMKKGPWTAEEDKTLVNYINAYGVGNWNAVPEQTGLARCGKSCRLRWANHLKPDLKKGAFSPEEERLIIQLHAQMGNKWARMAAQLPGRTDNEIKNYWNTRIKRQQRAGLPLYPPEVCLQASMDQNQLKDDETNTCGDPAINNFDLIPEIRFNNPELIQHYLDLPLTALLSVPAPGAHHFSYPDKSMPSTMPLGLHFSNVASSSNTLNGQYQSDEPFVYSTPSDSLLYGNPSSSEPTWATNLELPSLQTEVDELPSIQTQVDELPSIQTEVDEFPSIQTEVAELPSIQITQLDDNWALLSSIIHESQSADNPNNDASTPITSPSIQTEVEYSWHLMLSPLPPCESPRIEDNILFDPPQTILMGSGEGF